jgi:glutamine amidotransferase
MSGLNAVRGMRDAMDERVIKGGVPFLGICVGMQLMATEGHEKGVYAGLNWIMGPVIRLEPRGGLKVPHMGWNNLTFTQPHPLLANIPDGETGLHAYFVHSYHLHTTDERQLFATADYGQAVTACVGRDNMFGTQFHPEKSQTLGLTLIENFLEWKP